MSTRNPMLHLVCLSQMERKREWVAYSSRIQTQWTFIVAKKKQTFRAWRTLPVLKISRTVRTTSHGHCISHLTSGHGEVFGLRTRFAAVHVLSVPSLCCMVECRKDWVFSFLPPPIPNQHPLQQDKLLLPKQQHLCGHSLPCCCAEQGLCPQLLWTEGAAMQGLSPAHHSGFHTAALPLRHGIVLCEADEALNMNIKVCSQSQKLEVSIFNVGLGFGRKDSGVSSWQR